jgi:hypothetical protein
MKVFLHPGLNGLSEYFQEEDYNIPFLGSTLLDFVSDAYKRFAKATGQDLKILAPDIWEIGLPTYDYISSELNDEHEVVFITQLFNLPVLDFLIEDYQFLIQHPDKLFYHETGFQLGYVNKDSSIVEPKPDGLLGFKNVVRLSPSNFLKVNQSLVNNYKGESVIPGSYGLPVVASPRENIINSKVCAPCFIGEDVKLYNSVVYPGTVLTGNTVIENSEVFESFICEASIKNAVIKNSLVALASVDHVDLEDSVAPRGSVLINGRKR